LNEVVFLEVLSDLLSKKSLTAAGADQTEMDFPGKSGGTFDILTVSGGPNEPTKTTYLYR
jgi:hypothetical protein